MIRTGTRRNLLKSAIAALPSLQCCPLLAEDTRTYNNSLKRLSVLRPILEDFPHYVEPVKCQTRFEAPPLIDEPEADLEVRAWRWSYNARGIIEIPNKLRADRTAVIVVHPWAIDDGQGWKSPEPAGVAFQCTPQKNRLVLQHARDVINPLLKRLRGKAKLIAYSLPGLEDPIRDKIYRSWNSHPTTASRKEGMKELQAKLNNFSYFGGSLPKTIQLDGQNPVKSYFNAFPGLDAGDRYDPPGFWQLPVPVMATIDVALNDLVIYDGDGYPKLRDHLREIGIKHVILAGYNTDMCVCKTTAGYENLREDFNVFLVGDATIATFPGQDSPRHATNASVSFAALNLLITQSSWIYHKPNA
jgi:nicotinamidase-related amidase